VFAVRDPVLGFLHSQKKCVDLATNFGFVKQREPVFILNTKIVFNSQTFKHILLNPIDKKE
jgi:hypothetical protein